MKRVRGHISRGRMNIAPDNCTGSQERPQTDRQIERQPQVRESSKEHEGICVLVHRGIATEALVGGMSLQCFATGMVWLIFLIILYFTLIFLFIFHCYERGVREAQRGERIRNRYLKIKEFWHGRRHLDEEEKMAD